MVDSRSEALFHPVRLRIVQAFISEETLTVEQLKKRLPHVPQASLYRHLNVLVEHEFLHVIDEHWVGGARQRVYELVGNEAILKNDDLRSVSRDDHMRYFATFCAMLMQMFEQYIAQDEFDLEADGVGYRTVSIYLSDEEFQEVVQAMRAPLKKAWHNKPNAKRKRRIFATVTLLDAESTANNASDDQTHTQ